MANLSRGAGFFLLLVLVGTLPANFISASEKIDINAAHKEELVKIIHIGEARALELISLRPFSSLDDLARIKGIGPSRIEDIKNQGLAWVFSPGDEPQRSPGDETVVSSSTSLFQSSSVEESPQQYPGGIIFSRILPSPEGPDEENEQIELYNKNSFEVNLQGWQIKDEEGRTEVFTFPEESFIGGGQSLSLFRPLSGITLNNTGDSLVLLRPNGEIADSVSYGKAEPGFFFVLKDSGWTWEKPLALEKKKEDPSEKEGVAYKEKAAAGVGQEENPERNSMAGLAALLLASFSGIMILTLKRKMN